jgi:hypothetical protein
MDQVSKNLKIIERGLVVSGIMPINERDRSLSINHPFSVPPMRSDCADPVHFCVSSAYERTITLSLDQVLKALHSELGMPVLGVPYFDDKDGSKHKGGRRQVQLHYLDDEVTDGALVVLQCKAVLGGNYVPLNRRK